MNTTTNKRHDVLIAVCITVALFLLIDLLMGSWLLSITKGELPKDKFRVQHPVYHHTLIPNYEGIGYWGPGTYHVCTNGSAFKDSCSKVGVVEKSFDIAFMGDSFTEGVGMPYEQTFVGMIAAKNPNLKIANLGVVSYAPQIYLAKLRELYAQGYQFKKVIVFIDIGDVQDEALTYEVVDGKVISRHEQLPPDGLARARRLASRWFPLTGEAWNRIRASAAAIATLASSGTAQAVNSPVSSAPGDAPKATAVAASPPGDRGDVPSASPKPAPTQSPAPAPAPAPTGLSAEPKTAPAQPPAQVATAGAVPTEALKAVLFAPTVEPSIYDRNYGRSEWTYNTDSTQYGPDGVLGTVKKMLTTMDELYRLVRDHGGELSVGVYPWPGQIKYDTANSLQATVWSEFCATRCAHFYNAFPAFFDLLRKQGERDVIFRYYMGGDMHFNEEGNAVIAQTILNTGL